MISSDNKQSILWKHVALCCVLPLIYVGMVIYTKMAMGPYWLGSNIDPAYQYLLNGLNILQGVTPTHVDHPGTTLQMVCAAVIAAVSVFRPGELLVDFFTHPEVYMQAVSWTLIVLQSVSYIALGLYALHRSRDVFFALMVQAPTLILLSIMSYPSFGGVLTVPVNIFPETLLVTLTHLFMIGLIKLAFRGDKDCWGWLGFYFALVVGAALVTKISFGLLIFVPFVLLRSIRARVVYVLMSVVTFVVLTVPVWSRYDKMFGFMSKIVAHSGRHGSGGGAWLNWQDIAASTSVLVEHKLLLVVLFVGMIIVGLIIAVSSRRLSGPTGLLGVLALAMAGQVFLVLRHFSDHYMTPLLCLLGLGLALIYWAARALPYARIGAVVLMLFVSTAYTNNALAYRAALAENEASLLAFAGQKDAFQEKTGCMIVPFFRSSSVSYALSYGLIQGGGWAHPPYVDVLKQLYPGQLFYHKWARMMHDFYQMIPLEPAYQYLQSRTPCIVLYGQTMELDKNQFDVQVMGESGSDGGEGLFLIRKVTSDK